MTKDEVEAIVENTVTVTLMRLGITTPEEFLETKLDLAHLRAWRKANEQVKSVALKTAVGIVITGLLGWVATAIFNQ
jgi:predicted metalloprotease